MTTMTDYVFVIVVILYMVSDTGRKIKVSTVTKCMNWVRSDKEHSQYFLEYLH